MEPAEGLSDSQLISSLILLVTVTGGAVSGVRVSTSKYERVERGGGQKKLISLASTLALVASGYSYRILIIYDI